MKSPNNKDDITLKEFLQRKNRIKAELHQIQNDLDSAVHKVKDTFLTSIIPSGKIRSKPLKSVGIAILIGFVAGLPRGRKKRSGENSQPGFQNPGVSSLMFDEMKRIAARRAVHYFMNLVDETISGNSDRSRSRSSNNGEDEDMQN